MSTSETAGSGATDSSARARGRLLGGALWTLQVALAGTFLVAGSTKLTGTGAALMSRLAWAPDVPIALLRTIGLCELLGAIGILVPSATRIRPELTPAAACGLTTVMALAVMFHLYRGDHAFFVPAALAGLSALVAWGRSRKAPIAARARAG
jgi:putative oxidoreductase